MGEERECIKCKKKFTPSQYVWYEEQCSKCCPPREVKLGAFCCSGSGFSKSHTSGTHKKGKNYDDMIHDYYANNPIAQHE